MTKGYFILILALSGLMVFMGCTVSEYHPCCLYTNATQDQCVLSNGTIYDTEACDTDDALTCNVTVEEKNLVVPVCPQRESGKCNVSCSGIFCGRFEFDPRPSFSTSDAVKLDENDQPAPDAARLAPGLGADAAIGLYNAECRLENLTPAFMNTMTNGQGVTLNVFRFGVGNSFQEFDEASMYYPLTDKACQLNEMGSIDRYENYAIPNTLVEGSGAICREDAFGPGIWGCIPNLEIKSYSYYDCATRCLLDYAGDSPAVDAGNAYLTERNGQVLGNPFAYGVPDSYGSSAIIQWAYSTPGAMYAGEVPPYLLLGRDVKGSGMPPADGFSDDYSYGYTYYGAQFGKKNWNLGVTLANFGAPAFSTGTAYDYYYGQDSMLERAGLGDGAIQENFITVERDPHSIYAYLLAQHSVYGTQISQGHYTLGGDWAPGAEFECTQAGGECISGFCNTQDYHRGACKRLVNAATGETKEVNCGCREENGETVCDGLALYSAIPWDRYTSSIRVNATTPLSAPASSINIGFFLPSSITQTAMPSRGRVFKYDVGGYGNADGEKDYVLVMQLGGKSAYPDYSSVDYENDVDEAAYMNETLTIPQVLSRKQWGGCNAADGCGKFYTTFVDECMPSFSEDPNAYVGLQVCYFSNLYAGTYGNLLSPLDGTVTSRVGAGEGNNCERLYWTDRENDFDAFCYERDSKGDCVLYSASVLMVIARNVTYTDASGTEVNALAFGNCLFDADGERLDTTTYGYCDQCSFLTMAKDEVVPLPEEEIDGYEKGDGTRLGNKYCPDLKIDTIYPPWENGALQNTLVRFPESWAGGGVHDASGSGEDNAYRYSTCTMPDGTEAGKQVAWPDYLPNGYYLKSKIESYLKRNIQPVIFAEYTLPFLGGDEGAYKTYTGDSPMLSVRIGRDGKIDAGKTSSPFMVSLALNKRWLLDANDENAYPDDPSYFVGGGTFLADSVANQGPAIIVVKKLKEEDFGGAPELVLGEPSENIDWTLDIAGRRVDLLCPNCMVAVAAGYDDIGSGIPARMYQVSRLFGYTNATTGGPMWDNAYYGENASCFEEGMSCDYTALGKVDIIAVKWALGGRNSHCGIENEEERFAAILADEMEFGAKVLRRFGKPLVVTDFTIARNREAIYDGGVRDCWTDETAKRFMIYLGQHTEDLVKSGHTGLIYSDWTTDDDSSRGGAGTTFIRTEEGSVGSYRGDFFGGTYEAASLFAGKKEQTFFSMAAVSENCSCAACSSFDNPNMCNGRFRGTGALCDGYEDGMYAKWPSTCVALETCVMPAELPGYKVSCNVYYNNGTEAQENYSGSEIAANPQLYQDVIASIKSGDKIPCVESEGKAVSYLLLDTGGFRPFPLLFRKDGNMSFSCGQPSLDSFMGCGVTLPITNRRMDCVISRNELEIRLPPLGEAISGAGLPAGVGGGIMPELPGAGGFPGGIGG